MLSRIEILNLKEDWLRREIMLTMLVSRGAPEEIVHITHHPKVMDFHSTQDFLEYAAEEFPVFLRLNRSVRTYLSNLYGHLLKLQTLEQMQDGQLGLILEDDWLLNVAYDKLCLQLSHLHAHAQQQGHPFMAQLKTWEEEGFHDDVNSVPITDALKTPIFPNTFFYGERGLGIWANVFDNKAASLFKNWVIANIGNPHKKSCGSHLIDADTDPVMQQFLEDVFAIDVYVYYFMGVFPCYTVKTETEFFIENLRKTSYHYSLSQQGIIS